MTLVTISGHRTRDTVAVIDQPQWTDVRLSVAAKITAAFCVKALLQEGTALKAALFRAIATNPRGRWRPNLQR